MPQHFLLDWSRHRGDFTATQFPQCMSVYMTVPSIGVSSMKLALQAQTKSLIGIPASMRAMVAALIQALLLPAEEQLTHTHVV